MTNDANEQPGIRVEYAFLCDAATQHGGKVNALGIGIDQLGVTALPAMHPRLTLVARLVFEAAAFEDQGRASFAFRVCVVDADGHDVLPLVDGSLHIEAAGGQRLTGTTLLVDLVNLQFTTIGPHEVQLSSDAHTLATLPIDVVRVATS